MIHVLGQNPRNMKAKHNQRQFYDEILRKEANIAEWDARAAAVREGKVKPGDMCFHCGGPKKGQWRLGPHGDRTLCNACGKRWSKVGRPNNEVPDPPPHLKHR